MRPFNLNVVVHPNKCKRPAYAYCLSCKEVAASFGLTDFRTSSNRPSVPKAQ